MAFRISYLIVAALPSAAATFPGVVFTHYTLYLYTSPHKTWKQTLFHIQLTIILPLITIYNDTHIHRSGTISSNWYNGQLMQPPDNMSFGYTFIPYGFNVIPRLGNTWIYCYIVHKVNTDYNTRDIITR